MNEVRNTRRFGLAEVQRIDPVRPAERRRPGDEPEQDGRDGEHEAPAESADNLADDGADESAEHHSRQDAAHGAEHTGTDVVTYGSDGELPEDDDDGDEATIDEYV